MGFVDRFKPAEDLADFSFAGSLPIGWLAIGGTVILENGLKTLRVKKSGEWRVLAVKKRGSIL